MNRIKFLREQSNMTQQELADKLNGAKSTIAMYEKEDRKPSLDVLIKLSEIFNVSIDYLLGKSTNPEPIHHGTPRMCPIYGKISAGEPNWAEQNIIGRIKLKSDKIGNKNLDEYFYLQVNGESMNKIIPNGAIVLIHKQDYVENGEIAVVLVDNDCATLKRFSKKDDVVVLTPESDDPTFEQQIYTQSTNIRILGKYVDDVKFN